MLPIKRILCPIDFSDFSLRALDQAGELATHFGAELCVLHVVQSPETSFALYPYGGEVTWNIADYQKEVREGAERELRKIVERSHQSIEVRPLLREGNAADEIVNAAELGHIDLIVIATHGLGGWRHLVFGSVAEKVIRLAPCPVLVLRAAKPEEN